MDDTTLVQLADDVEAKMEDELEKARADVAQLRRACEEEIAEMKQMHEIELEARKKLHEEQVMTLKMQARAIHEHNMLEHLRSDNDFRSLNSELFQRGLHAAVSSIISEIRDTIDSEYKHMYE